MAPGPATSAGLLRFFEEESLGIKIKPKTLMVFVLAFLILCIIVQISI